MKLKIEVVEFLLKRDLEETWSPRDRILTSRLPPCGWIRQVDGGLCYHWSKFMSNGLQGAAPRLYWGFRLLQGGYSSFGGWGLIECVKGCNLGGKIKRFGVFMKKL